ncbi:MAG: glycosyltransferase [Sulfitobacter sp.]
MIVVTHLLGTGHLTRAMTLARAVVSNGHHAVVVSGGVRPFNLNTDNLPFVQLPPLRSNGIDFTKLLDPSGTIVDQSFLDQRRHHLIETLAHEAPDVLVTELFPFGRRILRDEFISLLNAARALPKQPKILASIRDILAPPSKPKKVTFADDLIHEFYDAVLVHSDENITPLELSWPVSPALHSKLIYTGFVATPPPVPHPQQIGLDEILVSAGGGNVGNTLFSCAKSAAVLSPSQQWRILVGGQDAASRCAELSKGAPPNLTIEPARPDFRQLLHHAAASVSLCGYNTALDILQSRCPAVFVPFDDGNEVEQGIRAQALAKQPGIEVLTNDVMTPERLLKNIKAAKSEPREALDHTHTSGATKTVTLIAAILGGSHEI